MSPRNNGGQTIHAVILAAGKGERLAPITNTCHKSLFNLTGESVLSRLLNTLYTSGVSSFSIGAGWLYQDLKDAVQNHPLKDSIRVVRTPNYEIGPLQTLRVVLDEIQEDMMLLCPADYVVDSSVIEAVVNHESQGSMVIAVDRHSDFGSPVYADAESIVHVGDASEGGVPIGRSALTLLVKHRLIDYCREALENGMTKVVDAINLALQNGETIQPVFIERPWFDLDSLEVILAANGYLLEEVKQVQSGCIYVPKNDVLETGQEVVLASGTAISKSVSIVGPVYIGRGCSIGADSIIGPYVSIANGTQVGDGTRLRDMVCVGPSSIRDRINIKNAITFRHEILWRKNSIAQ